MVQHKIYKNYKIATCVKLVKVTEMGPSGMAGPNKDSIPKCDTILDAEMSIFRHPKWNFSKSHGVTSRGIYQK